MSTEGDDNSDDNSQDDNMSDHSSLSQDSALSLEYGEEHLNDEYGEVIDRLKDSKVDILQQKSILIAKISTLRKRTRPRVSSSKTKNAWRDVMVVALELEAEEVEQGVRGIKLVVSFLLSQEVYLHMMYPNLGKMKIL